MWNQIHLLILYSHVPKTMHMEVPWCFVSQDQELDFFPGTTHPCTAAFKNSYHVGRIYVGDQADGVSVVSVAVNTQFIPNELTLPTLFPESSHVCLLRRSSLKSPHTSTALPLVKKAAARIHHHEPSRNGCSGDLLFFTPYPYINC